MGNFFGWTFDGRDWVEGAHTPPEPWLRITVHDSTVGVVEYAPAFGGSGTAYSGCAPRTYFEDPAIEATDKPREVRALAAWFAALNLGSERDLVADLGALLVGEDELAEEPFVEELFEGFFADLGIPVSFE